MLYLRDLKIYRYSGVMMDRPKRYHPALVTLHWLIALFVFADLFLGYFYIRPMILAGHPVRGTDLWLKVHMAVGITILALLVVRFIIRLASRKPAPADAGHKALNILARVVHYALYFFVFSMTVVGLAFALQTERLQVAFLGAAGGPAFAGPGNPPPGGFPRPSGAPGTPLPGGGGVPGFAGPGNPGFRGRGSFLARLGFLLLPIHLYISFILIGLITLHILAAIYHQLIRRDRLLSRMWYGAA